MTPSPDPSPCEHYELKLFITGSTAKSVRAVAITQRICDENLRGCYTLEVIDVYQDPEATKAMQIIATPTLLKLRPEPLRRIIGDLSDEARVLAGLSLTSLKAAAGPRS